MLLTLISFVFVLGILVFVHELGHFLIAKKVGIRVYSFSLGFPPNIFSKEWRGTKYCIGIIPLGGYVRMAGENPAESLTGEPDEFMSKSVWQRAAVVVAGPAMNYILAIFISIGIFYLSGRAVVDTDRVIVGEVAENAPAEKAGLKLDDQIVAIDGIWVSNFDSLAKRINAKVEEEIELTWIRQNDTITKNIVTMASPVLNADASIDTVGIIGFYQKITGTEKYGVWESITGGINATHLIVVVTARFIYQFVTGEVSPKMIGGPIFIATQSGKEAKKGLAYLFRFMALLSVNLAVLNILPIPVLDGGHLVFLTIEKIKGSPLSMKARAISQQVGVLLLLGLIVFVTYNDIVRAVKGF